MLPNYVAPFGGSEGATAHTAATARTPGQTPSFFDKSTGFFYMRYTTHGPKGFTSHQKNEAMVKCLAYGTIVKSGDSIPFLEVLRKKIK